MTKQLTQKQIQQRQKINGKIIKFGCLPIFILLLIIIIIAVAAPESDRTIHNELVEQLNTAENRTQFDSVIVQLEELGSKTEDDSLKTAINLIVEGKESIWTKTLINNQFSAWDGSHKKLKQSVKDNLKDPSSFEHVETTYRKNNDNTLTVNMKYRGKNSFNAVVTENIWVKVNMYGDILEVLK